MPVQNIVNAAWRSRFLTEDVLDFGLGSTLKVYASTAAVLQPKKLIEHEDEVSVGTDAEGEGVWCCVGTDGCVYDS